MNQLQIRYLTRAHEYEWSFINEAPTSKEIVSPTMHDSLVLMKSDMLDLNRIKSKQD